MLNVMIGEANYRAEGDRLRDAGEFAQAAEAYLAHLAAHPDDFDIWVQRGNCLKDSGTHDAALIAYSRAVHLNPEDADVYLQMGHAYKLRGDKKSARQCYEKSYALDASSEVAASELRSLGSKLSKTESPLLSPDFATTPATILDISDLLAFLAVHSRVTGIQRVQSCIVNEILNKQSAANKFSSGHVLFAYCDQENQKFFAVSASSLENMLEELSRDTSDQDDLRKCLERVYRSKIEIRPRQDDIYVILGAFWIGSDYSSSLLKLKRGGVRVGVYIYDLIPITHPQFVTESTRQDVIDKFGDVMSLADFALTISEYVAKEVRSVLESELNRSIPVIAVPLSHELPADDGVEDPEDLVEFKSGLPEEYVLCVCTLEGRKNHLLLLNIWQSISRKFGDKCPSLVLVGKWGWRIEEFRNRLNSTRNAEGKIVVLGNVSDSELKYLYQNCLFTVFPSFVEGWGLPVGESLAYGKPCIASNTSSIPEVGGDFCRYINPYDPVGAQEVVETVISDREGLASWTADIRAKFLPRTWLDVANHFLSSVDAAVKSASTGIAPPVTLTPAKLYYLTSASIYGSERAWVHRSLKFVTADGWRQIEDWGIWSSKRKALLAFGTGFQEGTSVRVLLQLRVPPPSDMDLIRISSHKSVTTAVAVTPKWVPFEAVVGKNGVCEIEIERLSAVEQLDVNRPLYIGLSALGFHASDDICSRLDLLESMLLR